MATSITALVKPALLTWARESANLEPLAAARKILVPDGRIEQWETGDAAPTIVELRRAATVYNRPLAVFYLPEPPQGFETLRDFRRLQPGGSRPWSAGLHAEYRRAHFQREALLEIAELDDVAPPHGWRLTGLPADDQLIASQAREGLLAASRRPQPRASGTEYDHLNFWTAALEEAGVLVMSTEGGHVSTDEMRGFALFFEVLPVIVLNGADWPRGRMFSLLHEYAHLLLHAAGLCDTTTDRVAPTENRRIEAQCNAVAASLLMPADQVLTHPLVVNHEPGEDWTLADLIEAARPFGVSVEAFLRRLVALGRATMANYQAFRDEAEEQGTLPGKRPTGGNFYNTKARDLGTGYVRVVSDAHRRTLIDSHSAATYLDVKVGQISRLARAARI